MPKGKQLGARSLKSQDRLAALRSFLDPRRPVSVRYCLYQLATRGLYPSTAKKHYRSTLQLTVTARISGELDDECFTDNKRVVHSGEWNGFENLAQYQKPSPIERYSRDRWQDQPRHLECWLEKDTTAPLVKRVINQWDITLRVSAGSFSRPFLVRAAEEIAKRDRPTVIFYIGDFDPSGLSIESVARKGNGERGNRRREGLFDLLIQKHGWTAARWRKQITWKRIAATEKDLRTMPAKFRLSIKEATEDSNGDPHAPGYKETYGDKCVEVEAIEVLKVGELAERLDNAIRNVIDLEAWEESGRKEAEEKRTGRSIR